jgi:hypothetical protein
MLVVETLGTASVARKERMLFNFDDSEQTDQAEGASSTCVLWVHCEAAAGHVQ